MGTGYKEYKFKLKVHLVRKCENNGITVPFNFPMSTTSYGPYTGSVRLAIGWVSYPKTRKFSSLEIHRYRTVVERSLSPASSPELHRPTYLDQRFIEAF
jgi:hypothetical protein